MISGWPAPLCNLYFVSFLLICTSFVVRTRGIVFVIYLLSRLANYKAPCERCVLAHDFGPVKLPRLSRNGPWDFRETVPRLVSI